MISANPPKATKYPAKLDFIYQSMESEVNFKIDPIKSNFHNT